MSQLIAEKGLTFCKQYFVYLFRLKSMLVLVCATSISYNARAQSDVAAKVIAVIDGNTLEVQTRENPKLKLVLDGIDSPELEQQYGIQAKAFLEKIVRDKQILIGFKGKDAAGNHLVIVNVDRLDVRIELLKEGLAWTSEKNPSTDLEPYKIWAQRKGRGLWQQDKPVAPWTFRRQQAMAKPKIR